MDNSKLADELRTDEGLRLFPYQDTVGKMTIGIGRNLTDVGISLDEAKYLLNNDIDKVVKQLNIKLPWWVTLSENRQRVLANMAFNLGINKLLGFNSTLAYLQTGQYDKAADGMIKSTWAKQVGARADRLAKMMREG